MLDRFIDQLQDSIHRAQVRDDIALLHIVRHRMEQVQVALLSLPPGQQVRVQLDLDRSLPMEWPLWMEACRFDDGDFAADTAIESLPLH